MGAMRWSWIFDRDLQRDFIGGVGYRNTLVPSDDALKSISEGWPHGRERGLTCETMTLPSDAYGRAGGNAN